jgi:putative transcriptional regulator
MPERDIGVEILEGIPEIKQHKAGKAKLRTRTPKRPAPAKHIRAKLDLSQAAFASLMGVSLRTVQDWEQGRRQPSGPAEALLRIAEQHLDVFLRLA